MLSKIILFRLINLTRLTLKARKGEEKQIRLNGGSDPDLSFKKPSESKGGVLETFIKVNWNILNIKIPSIT